MTKKQIIESMKLHGRIVKHLADKVEWTDVNDEVIKDAIDSYPTDEMIESMMKGVTVE